ncbi:MAG: hypothetical protein R2865_14940 [Deinococcales bacterium]
MPLLIMHSRFDTIPYHLGRKTFRVAQEPKQFVKLSGSHNSIVNGQKSHEALKAIKDFLQQYHLGD